DSESRVLDPFAYFSRGQTNAGTFAVGAFLLVSGFLVAHSWSRSKGAVDFLRRRVLRIYPGFIACVAFCVLLVGPLGARDFAAYWHNLSLARASVGAIKLGGVEAPPVFSDLPNVSTNGSLWTIRYEFACYLILVAMGLLGLLRRKPTVVAAFLISTVLFIGERHWNLWMPQGATVPILGLVLLLPRLLAWFTAGVLFYTLREQLPDSSRTPILRSAVLAIAALTRGVEIVMPLAAGYLLLYFVFSDRIRLWRFAERGDLSYGLYLYSSPIQQLLVRWFGVAFNFA